MRILLLQPLVHGEEQKIAEDERQKGRSQLMPSPECMESRGESIEILYTREDLVIELGEQRGIVDNEREDEAPEDFHLTGMLRPSF
jgi:hypothetical protein